MSSESLFRSYGLDYHYTHLSEAIDACGPLAGKRVLEIGGCLPRGIVIGHYKAAQWIGVDLPAYWEESGDLNPSSKIEVERKPLSRFSLDEDTDHICLEGDVTNLSASFDGKFDLVFSTSALEHVSDIHGTLSAAARILKPGGMMFAIALRLWLSSSGHHLPPIFYQGRPFTLGDAEYPPWGHLYMTPEAMTERLTALQLPEEVISQVIHFTYLSNHINRALPEEYEQAFELAGFSGGTIALIYEAPVPADIQARLEACYGQRRFDQWGIKLIGQK